MKLATTLLLIVLVSDLLNAQTNKVKPGSGELLRATVVINNRYEELELKQLVAGSTALYSYKNSLFFITVQGINRYIHLPFQQGLRDVDDGYVRKRRLVNTTYHIDTLLKYLPEKQFEGRIRSLLTINATNLQTLISDYNRFVEEGIAPFAVKAAVKTENTELKLLVEGKITLYQSGSGENMQFYIFKDGHDAMIHLPVVKSEHAFIGQNLAVLSYPVYDKSFQDSLRKYMSDAPIIANQTWAMGFPTASSLSSIVRKYNAEFETKFSLLKEMRNVKFSINPGIQFYNYIYHPMQEDSVTLFSGFLAGISYQRGDYSIGFSTGILFPELGFLNRYYKYPFRMHFAYNSGPVSPVLSVSMISNSTEIFNFKTYSVGIGADIKLYRNFYLSIYPELEMIRKDTLTPIDGRRYDPVLSLWSGIKLTF